MKPGDMKKFLSTSKDLDDLLEGKLQTYNHSNYVSAIWCEEKTLEGIELPNGSKVRLRTKGNGCYLGKFELSEKEDIEINRTNQFFYAL